MDIESLRNKKKQEKRAMNSRRSSNSFTHSNANKSCVSSGDAEYHYHLAKCYEKELEGFEHDEGKMFDEFLKAAELGHTKAMVEVGFMYAEIDEDDSIVPFDEAKARFWGNKAIECDNPDGYYVLGELYATNGHGSLALEMYQKGASLGSQDCMEELAYGYYFGLCAGMTAEDIDQDKAFEIVRRVDWDDEHTLALGILADYYLDREGCPDEAVKCHERILKEDSESYGSKLELAKILRNYEECLDYHRAYELFLDVADNGYNAGEAMNFLGLMFYNGEGVDQNERKAIEWFEKAAAKGNVTAMYNLGMVCKNNEDMVHAQVWFGKAAGEGHEDAQEQLKSMEEYSRSYSNMDGDYKIIQDFKSYFKWCIIEEVDDEVKMNWKLMSEQIKNITGRYVSGYSMKKVYTQYGISDFVSLPDLAEAIMRYIKD